MTVDPKDTFETSMRLNTHFWKTFMMRSSQGQLKYLAFYQNKNDKDLIPVFPDSFGQNFQEIGVTHAAQISLIECKMKMDIDDEEGEDEIEEGMEDEQEEMEYEQEEEEKPEEVDQENGSKKVEPTEEAKHSEAAQEFLFDNDKSK